MIKIFLIFSIIFYIQNIFAKNIEETEIITDEGIEVFQDEKYYLLKKNVKIKSNNFLLNADNVKAFFNNDLYDITFLSATGNAVLDSDKNNFIAIGNKIDIDYKTESIEVIGKNSILDLQETKMYSDGSIYLNNALGNFLINGENSKLQNTEVYIEGNIIEGKFNNNKSTTEITELNVFDDKNLYIKNNDLDMYAKKAIYKKNINIIELFEDVKIIRGAETITGDYGIFNTVKNSYKVKSNNNNKVKVKITNAE